MSREDLLSVLQQKANEPNYPLIPHLRYTGNKHLLLWHTHNEQHQVFLANSIEQSIELWNVAQKEEGLEASAKELWNVTIVMPPEWVANKYNKQCYEEDIHNFIWHTCFEIDEYRKRHKQLPPNVVPCKSVEHDDCKCLGGKYLPTVSWDVLFKKDWAAPPSWTGSVRAAKKRILKPFDGILADENVPLFVCELNGGHHSRGITFTEIAEDSHIRRDSSLFFFQGQKINMPKEIIESVGKLKAKEEEKKKQDERKANERWTKSRRESDESLLKKLL